MKQKEEEVRMARLANKIYQHKDKSVGKSGYPHDGKYVIVQYARLKNPATRIWQECVIYSDIKTKSVYVREEQDFFDEFELV